MTKQDFAELARLANRLPAFDRVGVFSPIKDGERLLFPNAIRLPRRKWDLNDPSTKRFDVLIAANVFLCSPDPARWFNNVLSSSKYFVLLDVVRRQRSESGEFGNDGDRMRYAVGGETPRTEMFFDLSDLGDQLLAFKTYFGGSNRHDDAPLHVLAVVKGNLADPLVRIDDYPSGIRPILDDLTPLHDVIQKFEDAGISYHLGIVPALLTDAMIDFLNSLKRMIPVVHGFDHRYPKYATKLVKKGDPYNQKTVGVFNEFSGQSYDEILRKLTDGRALLEDRLNRAVTGYIPPCNIGDRKTAKALEAAGYEKYLSEKRIPGCTLPWIRSDFYGRSPDFNADKNPAVSTFHTTWEWDVVRSGDAASLDRVIESLQQRSAESWAMTKKMADLV